MLGMRMSGILCFYEMPLCIPHAISDFLNGHFAVQQQVLHHFQSIPGDVSPQRFLEMSFKITPDIIGRKIEPLRQARNPCGTYSKMNTYYFAIYNVLLAHL